MLPSLSSFAGQYRTRPYEQVMREVGRLKQLDGKPGDKNANESAISVDIGGSKLDAVLLRSGSTGTVVQMVTEPNGDRTIGLLDIPLANGSVPMMSGFEIRETEQGVFGRSLESGEENYPNPAKYYLSSLSPEQAANGKARAKAVLASFEVGLS